MKNREQYIKEHIKQYGLFPIDTRVVIIFPKSDFFMRQGIIRDHFDKSSGFYWDYTIKLDTGEIVHFDKGQVDKI